MKKTVFVLVMYLCMAYQGYAQTHDLIISAFYPQISDTIEWTEGQIISILEKGDTLFCKLDEDVDPKRRHSYVKNMEFTLDGDSVFESAYMESRIFSWRCWHRMTRCDYLIMNDRFGNQLELTEDALKYLPKLSKYLKKKIRRTDEKECTQGYLPLDGKKTRFLESQEAFFFIDKARWIVIQTATALIEAVQEIGNHMFLSFIYYYTMAEITIPFQRLSDKAKVPTQATFSDAGYDLFSTESYILKPGERKLFKTNISTAIPHGYYGRIAPRSGLAYKHGIDVLAGVIDSGYRGDIGIILINFGHEDFPVNEGDKIAQFIIEKCHYVERQEVETLPESESQRGEGGFGSTGKN